MNIQDELPQQGFAIVPAVYSAEEIASISDIIASEHPDEVLFGMRRFLQRTPELATSLFNPSLKSILHEMLPGCFCIQSIYFDKPPESNGFVPWHQDRIIFVKEKTETYGFKNWTQKENEYGVQPPAEYLGNIVTVRIHLDDADADNGALKVIPYSHSEGFMRTASVSFSDSDATVCTVKAGAVMLMKPLLFHSSTRSATVQQRRVVHLEFCNLQLPQGMEWSQKMVL